MTPNPTRDVVVADDVATSGSTSTWEQISRARCERLLEIVAKGAFSPSGEGRLSCRATRPQRVVHDNSLIGWACFVLVAFAIYAAWTIPPAIGIDPRSNWVLLFILGGFAALIGIPYLGYRVYHRWLDDVIILDDHYDAGGFLLDEYETAVRTLTECAAEGVADAGRTVEAATAMRPGLEELAVEYARFDLIASTSAGQYAERDYAAEARRVATELRAALAAGVADVQTSARFLFNQRTTLAVPVPQVTEQRPVLPSLRLSAEAQAALENARNTLRELA